jgi:adenosine deaminase
MEIKNWPKVELHLHLDCSLSFDVVRQLSPGISLSEYQNNFIGPPKCHNLADYLTRANAALKILQSEEALELAVVDLFKQWQTDHVVYGEVRFAPLLHIKQGLKSERVVEIVNRTVEECVKSSGIEASIILCTLRHFSEAQGMETIKLVQQFIDTHVSGFDIASDEAGYPIDAHIKPFQYAREKMIPCTAHAGEAKGADSVWETLQHFKPLRIGHGVRSMEDPLLIKHLAEQQIHLEVCPTSNIQTNVYDQIFDHRVMEIYDAGISMSLNTDARAISDITLLKEYGIMQNVFGWKQEHFRKCNLEGIKHAFTSPEIKEKVRKKILEGFQV